MSVSRRDFMKWLSAGAGVVALPACESTGGSPGAADSTIVRGAMPKPSIAQCAIASPLSERSRPSGRTEMTRLPARNTKSGEDRPV